MKNFSTLAFAFLAFTASAGVTPSDDNIRAFSDIYLGNAQWPVWRLVDRGVTVDGVVNEDEWSKAHPIFLTGEHFWNKTYYSNAYGWKGFSDLIALFRVLYDSDNLYVSVIYFDDAHFEGNSMMTEPWIYNDALELTFLPLGLNYQTLLQYYKQVSLTMGPVLNAEVPPAATRINRRYTARSGLVGWRGGVRYPGSLVEVGWDQSEPEGSANLGGVRAAVSPVRDPLVTAKYPGAYALEMSIPLSAIGRYQSGTVFPSDAVPAVGDIFKMNFMVSDDDDAQPKLNDKYLMWANTERFAPPWWSDLDGYNLSVPETWHNLLYYPSFAFAGFKDHSSGSGDWDKLTDERNLYFDHESSDYANLLPGLWSAPSNASSVSRVPENTAGKSDLGLFPNPFSGSGHIEFFVPTAGPTRVGVYNLSGVRVAGLAQGSLSAGFHSMAWNGLGTAGLRLSPGLYVLKLESPGKVISKPLIIVK